jgi:CHAT domain-containing protein
MDGAARYIPLGALWDGERHLAETFSSSLLTLSTLDRLERPLTALHGNLSGALALGASRGKDPFRDLPYAAEEIKAVLGAACGEGVGRASRVPEKPFLNRAFTKEALEACLNSASEALHIASPFRLLPANPALSELMLGDGKSVSLGRIKALSRPDAGAPELVTLSACETFPERFGADGSEIELLGEILQEMGVTSALASLWRPDGLSATAVMREFYRLHFAAGLGKAEALQEAQMTLMHAGPDENLAVSQTGEGPSARKDPLADADTCADGRGSGRSHPYYWAPFVLIGDWR